MTAKRRAQSAMEYLMTYGWAILIIAVVLSALFSLGVFSSGSLLGTSCVAGPGYLCSGISITVQAATDNMMLTFGQSTGSALYNVGMGCAASTSATGLPNPATAIIYLSGAGAATGVNPASAVSGSLTMQSGSTISVTGLVCFDSKGNALNPTTSPIGTAFSGGLWVNYTLSSGAPGASNPLLVTKFASITAKVA